MADSMDQSPQWYDPTGGAGSLGAEFGQRPSNSGQWTGKGAHTGQDYRIGANSAAYSISGGKITAAGFDPTIGNYATLEVSPGRTATYAHLNKLNVKTGDLVKGGQQIGLTGNSGSSSRGAHLHVEYTKDGSFVSPEFFYGKDAPSWTGRTSKGAPQNMGKAFTYKGSSSVDYSGDNVKSTPGDTGTTNLPESLGARLTSSGVKSNIVSRIF